MAYSPQTLSSSFRLFFQSLKLLEELTMPSLQMKMLGFKQAKEPVQSHKAKLSDSKAPPPKQSSLSGKSCGCHNFSINLCPVEERPWRVLGCLKVGLSTLSFNELRQAF